MTPAARQALTGLRVTSDPNASTKSAVATHVQLRCLMPTTAVAVARAAKAQPAVDG